MNELSLFTGIGGGLLGTKLLGWNHIGYVEWDKYCCKGLERRIKDGILDDAPIWNLDIREFNKRYAEKYRGLVDVITAGFPCQPFSVAGKRAGADDERNMWPATIECIRKIRPRYALLENVPSLLISGYFGTILGDLAESGYNIKWRCLSAAEVGAPHYRNRLWIIAYSNSIRFTQSTGISPKQHPYILGKNSRGWDISKWQIANNKSESPKYDFKSILCRNDDGIPNRVDRLRAIGNGQVPTVVATVWRLLTEDL